jgi:hypothetical protein
MSQTHPMLEYELAKPEVEEAPVSLARVLAFGYIAACTLGLILMGVVKVMQV